MLATCSRDKSVWVWALEQDDYECLEVLHGHSQDVKSVAWHPSEPLLVGVVSPQVSCSYDDTIKFWREVDEEWQCVRTLAGHSSIVWEIAFNGDGSMLVSCGDDKAIIVWERQSGDQWRRASTLSGFVCPGSPQLPPPLDFLGELEQAGLDCVWLWR